MGEAMSKKGLPSSPAALLGCYSNFTFLAGASHPAEMVEAAAALGWQAVGIADVNSLAGIVRAHVAARDAGIGLVVGARLRPVDGPDIIAHPTDRAGYEALSVLLSEANMRGSKGAPVPSQRTPQPPKQYTKYDGHGRLIKTITPPRRASVHRQLPPLRR